MKKIYLLIISSIMGLITFGQSTPNNVDIGLFANGSNGSNAGSGAYVEVSLRIKTASATGYSAPPPVAEDFVLYLVAPKTDFDLTDAVVISQVNAALYGATTTSLMTPQGVADIGAFDPNNLYFPIVLNMPGSGLNLNPLSPVTHAWNFAFTFTFNNAKTPGAYNKIRIVDQLNNTALSAYSVANGGGPLFTNLIMQTVNQLTNQAFTVLPVNFINFSGYKNGNKNVLRWTTASEQNSQGFEVQRATDGINYSRVGFVNSTAPGGISSSQLSYTFDDNNPIGKKQYYRLRQIDIDGRSKMSNIVMIKGDMSGILSIGGLFPNPASTQINVIIDAPKRDKITVVMTDMAGKTVIQQQANVDMGSNTVPVEIAKLAGGSYLVKLICQSSDCESAVGKFNKQ